MTAPADAPITEQEVEAMAQRIAQWSDFNRAEAAALLRRLWAERDALRQDAQRYRLLRDRAPSFNRAVFELTGRWPEGVSDADQRLDAARAALEA